VLCSDHQRMPMRFNLSLRSIAAILLISPPANPSAPEKLSAGYSSSRENESIQLRPGLEHSLLGGSTRVVQTISGYVRNRAVRRFSGTLRQGRDLWCNSKPEEIALNKSEEHFPHRSRMTILCVIPEWTLQYRLLQRPS
jgi:hypothetical protein